MNGIQLGNVIEPEIVAGKWKQFFEVWNSGTANSIDIAILN